MELEHWKDLPSIPWPGSVHPGIEEAADQADEEINLTSIIFQTWPFLRSENDEALKSRAYGQHPSEEETSPFSQTNRPSSRVAATSSD